MTDSSLWVNSTGNPSRPGALPVSFPCLYRFCSFIKSSQHWHSPIANNIFMFASKTSSTFINSLKYSAHLLLTSFAHLLLHSPSPVRNSFRNFNCLFHISSLCPLHLSHVPHLFSAAISHIVVTIN